LKTQVLNFTDCVAKIEAVGNTVRVHSALEMLRDNETFKYLPKEQTAQGTVRNLSEELDDTGEGAVAQDADPAGACRI
jgi:hypothetical protein